MIYIYERLNGTREFSHRRREEFVHAIYIDLQAISCNIDMADMEWMVDLGERGLLTRCTIFGCEVELERVWGKTLKVVIHGSSL